MSSQTPLRRLLGLANRTEGRLLPEADTPHDETRQVGYVDRLERLMATPAPEGEPEPVSKRRRASRLRS